MFEARGRCLLLYGLIIFCLMICCGPGRDGDEGPLFSLEQILIIDTENDATAELGLTDIASYDIDSEGNIFIANPEASEHYIFMLNDSGGLVTAFGRQGEGPGEIQSPRELAVSNRNEVYVTDRGKVVVFSNTGRFTREFRIDNEYQRIIPLDQNRSLAIAVRMNEDLSQSFQVILCSSDFKEIQTLDQSTIASFKKAAKVNMIPTLVYWETSQNHVYTGSTGEYEIRVFDFDGNLLRRIRKRHQAVPLSEENRMDYEQRLEGYPAEIRENFFIPDAFPPFRDIVARGDEWLFVRTYEEPREGSSIYDIFDDEGAFVDRAELEGYQVKFKGDRAYCLKQKDSGYKELVVNRIIWD